MAAQLMKVYRQLFGTVPVDNAKVEGLPLPPVQINMKSWQKQINDVREMQLRDDDVILCAYPKAGTHWLWEVMSMLLAGRAEYEPRAKELLMMDVTKVSKLNKLGSARVLNTHLPFSMLPAEQMLTKRLRVVHVYRNPRDVMISMFHHVKQFNLMGTDSLQSFMKLFLAGEVIYGHYARFLNQMDRFMYDHPELPVFNVSFEDMKRDPIGVVRRLAEYLQVPATEELITEIVDACSFNKLKKVDETKEQVTYFGLKIGQKCYRKGEVGDWANCLTEEEVETFDREFNKILETSRFQFQYKL